LERFFRYACISQFVVTGENNRLDTISQVAPELLCIFRAWNATLHAYDGNVRAAYDGGRCKRA
jgi:hypothetical protein